MKIYIITLLAVLGLTVPAVSCSQTLNPVPYANGVSPAYTATDRSYEPPAIKRNLYVSGYVGAAIPKSDNLSATDKPIPNIATGHVNFSTAPLFGVKGGYWFSNDMGLQLDLVRYTTAQSTTATIISRLPVAVSFTSNQTVTAYTVNGLYRFSHDGRVTPYVGAGVGMYEININAGVARLTSSRNTVTYDMIPTLISYKLGGQVLGGLDYRLSDRVSAFVEYKHSMVNALGINGNYNTDQVYTGLTFYFR